MRHDVSPTGEWIAIQTCEPFMDEGLGVEQRGGDPQIFLVKNPLAQIPVGGEIIPLTLLIQLILLTVTIVAAIAIGYTMTRRKPILH